MQKKIFEFCCLEMATHIENDDLHLRYSPKFREYGIRYSDDGLSLQLISFCPWCGSRLAPSLREEWFDEIDALGLDPDGDIPSDYKTDDWWREKPRS